MAAEAATVENEVARNLLDVGNKLLSPPSDVEELLKLLNLAEDFLSQVKQAPPASLNTALYRVLKALVAKDLLNHSEMDVKIALASCFSEITFITAPAHPYNEDLMKDIFRIIVGALKNIGDSSSRTYYKKVSILETIAKVHSCIMMLDLDCDDLILEMFQHFLKTITPANEGRVFSFMETIMTELLNDIEDKLLPRLLESLVIDIKDGSPIARRLGEKVIANCAGKLKPYLIELDRSNGYRDIIASICQENYDIPEMNLPSTSVECLELIKDQYNLEESRLSSRTKSRRKCTRAVKEVSEVETSEKELDKALVGSKIKVWWPDDQEFYEGVVESFDPISKKHKVSYFDGDEEFLFLKDECWKFLKDNTKPEFVWRQQKENPRADASSNVLNMVWEHCERVAGDARRKLKCLHCSKIVSNLGNMKRHLARTGNGIVRPCTHASQEVEKLFRDMVSQIKPTSLDPTWEHCEKVAGNPRWKLKCVHCLKIISGITRMKYHLARANKISQPCSSCPQEVEDFFINLISQLESGK